MNDAKTIMLVVLALVVLVQAFYLLVLYGRLVKARRATKEVLARTESVLGKLNDAIAQRLAARNAPNHRRNLQ